MKKLLILPLVAVLALVMFVPAQAQDGGTERPVITPDNIGELTELYRMGRGEVLHLNYHAETETLAAITYAGVWLYDINDLETIEDPPLLPRQGATTTRPSKVDFSADGSLLVQGDQYTYFVWDVATQEITQSTDINTNLTAVEFTADESAIYGGASNGEIAIYEFDAPEDEEVERTLNEEHTSRIHDLELSPDGSVLASASEDDTARLLDPETLETLFVLEHAGNVNTLMFNADGSLLITASDDDTAVAWDVATGEAVATFTPEERAANIISLALSDDGSQLFTADNRSNIYVWDIESGEFVASLAEDPARGLDAGYAQAMAMTPAGLATGMSQIGVSVLAIYNPEDGSPVTQATGHGEGMNGVDFSPNGETLLFPNEDGTIYVWPVAEAPLLADTPVIDYEEDLTTSAFSPHLMLDYASDGSFAAVVDGFDGFILNPDDLSVVHEISIDGLVNHLAISPNNDMVLFDEEDGAVAVSVETGEIVFEFNTMGSYVTDYTFNPAQTLVAVTSADGTVRIFGLPAE